MVQRFLVYSELHKHHHNIIKKFFITSKRNPVYFSSYSLCLLLTHSLCLVPVTIAIDLSIEDILHKWHHIMHFYIWFLSQSKIFLNLSMLLQVFVLHYFLLRNDGTLCGLYYILFIHSLVGVQLCCFHFLAIRNNAFMTYRHFQLD